MCVRTWEELPKRMQTEAVYPYYLSLQGKAAILQKKRLLDVILAGLLLGVFFPLLLVLALWIRLDSPGPIFYRQERITQYGRKYRIFKFRTMEAGADKKGPLITEKQDRRITGAGRILRKYRLDELPQLLNVLAGDMSFVGTRPEVPKYVAEYEPEMWATLLLPAGITSPASIAYRKEEERLETLCRETQKKVDQVYIEYILPEKMAYNFAYIKEVSIQKDLVIMCQTVLAVLGFGKKEDGGKGNE